MGSLQMDATQEHSSATCEVASLTLDESGMIRDCCRAAEKLFGYSLRQLCSQHVSALIPQLSGIEMVQEGQVNPKLAYLCRCGHLFRAESRYGDILPSELSLVRLENAGRRMLKLFVLPSVAAAS
jgi:PAS domain S-box-containing protein